MAHISKMKRRLIAALIITAALGAAAAAVIPWMETMYDPDMRDRFTGYVDSLGFIGYLLMFGIQVIQVIIAIIPGEPVELMAGALYGGLGGLITCLIGSTLASAAIFIVMRRFGQPFLDRIFSKKQLREFGFIHDTKKLEAVTLVLFLLPGTPKDMLTYVAGTTPIPMVRFLVISAFARIPSVASSTFIGDSVLSGNWHAALILTLAALVLGLAGIFFRERAMAFCKRHSRKAKV